MDRTTVSLAIESLRLTTGGGEIVSSSVSNVPDRLIDFFVGLTSAGGGCGLSVDFSNVSDRAMDAEKLSRLIGITFDDSIVELLPFVGGKLLEKSFLRTDLLHFCLRWFT